MRQKKVKPLCYNPNPLYAEKGQVMIALAYILGCIAVLSALAMFISKTQTKMARVNLALGILCLLLSPYWARQQEHRLAGLGACALWLIDVIILSITVFRHQRVHTSQPPTA